MMAEELYNAYYAMNERGRAIENKISDFIEKILSENVGVDLVDLEAVFNQSVGAHFAESRLRYATKKRKSEK